MNTSIIQEETIVAIVQKITRSMNLDCQVELRNEIQDGKPAVVVSIHTPDHGKFLIGKNGQNLQAFEHVLRAMVSKESKENNGGQTILVDVNDYRKSRALYVLEVAKQAVARVRNTQRAEALMPMSAYERRVVHMELASLPDVATESVGQEPQRRIVIKPYRLDI